MKKLKLNLDELKNAEVLTREQLKTVVGGMTGSDCFYTPGPGIGTCNVLRNGLVYAAGFSAEVAYAYAEACRHQSSAFWSVSCGI